MKLDRFRLSSAIALILIFGGGFAIRYFRTREIAAEYAAVCAVGFVLLAVSLAVSLARRRRKETNKNA
ncbi:hypothetical protein [Cohnella algarum]|uniref:hypothetical protein n=1 Tax=Cohnella algarum TaxID=2044859 RepID=UPI0019672F8B|nr:hypothetical protein [Cohnella algarum]MBN2984160.1 hypothetical protein [Cohnella algarum]